jgi:NAD(P)-dependent dehydrogenase (short-subunit alcohol dehydrogenase family)
VIADLATAAGREAMVEGVRAASAGRLDGVIACAGVRGGGEADIERVIGVNYFGAHATLDRLRPLLVSSTAPRAAAIGSLSAVIGHFETSWDDALVETCLAGDEGAAVAAGGTSGTSAYASAKRALMTWIRRAAPGPEWAGCGIPLNAIAPGVIRTPINEYLFETPEAEARAAHFRPQPLGWGQPEHVAPLLAWLAGPTNEFVSGQIVCIDGGYEALVRPTVV